MSPTLIIHIISSIFTLLFCSYALYSPGKNVRNFLHLLTITSISTGVVTAFNTTGITTIFCAKIGIYLLMIISTQIILAKKINSKLILNPNQKFSGN